MRAVELRERLVALVLDRARVRCRALEVLAHPREPRVRSALVRMSSVASVSSSALGGGDGAARRARPTSARRRSRRRGVRGRVHVARDDARREPARLLAQLRVARDGERAVDLGGRRAEPLPPELGRERGLARLRRAQIAATRSAFARACVSSSPHDVERDVRDGQREPGDRVALERARAARLTMPPGGGVGAGARRPPPRGPAAPAAAGAAQSAGPARGRAARTGTSAPVSPARAVAGSATRVSSRGISSSAWFKWPRAARARGCAARVLERRHAHARWPYPASPGSPGPPRRAGSRSSGDGADAPG